MDAPSYLQGFADLTADTPFAYSPVSAGDGYTLSAYVFGARSSEPVVIVNPIGSSPLLMFPLARALAETRNVVTYENRYSPYLGEEPMPGSTDFDTYVYDLEAVLERFAPEKYHLIAHCSSARVALWALTKWDLRPASLTLIAPSSVGCSGQLSGVQALFFSSVMKLPLLEEEKARAAVKAIQDLAGRAGEQPGATAVQRLTYLSIRDYESTRRYARLLSDAQLALDDGVAMFDEACRAVPILIVHASDDPVESYHASIDAVTRNAAEKCKLTLHASGGHFVAYDRACSVGADIAAFQDHLSPN